MADHNDSLRFSQQQTELNEQYASMSADLERLSPTSESIESLHKLRQSEDVQKLAAEFEADPKAQPVLDAYRAATAELQQKLDSEPIQKLSALYDMKVAGASDAALLAAAKSQGIAGSDASSGSGASPIDTSIIAYLKDQGHTTALVQEDYNGESDAMVFSYLAYMSKFSRADGYYDDATKAQSTNSAPLTIEKYIEDLLEKGGSSMKPEDREFLKALRGCKRYKDLKIVYNEANNSLPGVQDHVIAVEYAEGGYVIAVEGTDGTSKGWQTNRDLLSPEISEAEAWVLQKINAFMDRYSDATFDLTGHSRGAHLAISTAVLIEPDKLANIRSVSALDAPGFHKQFIQTYLARVLALQGVIQNWQIENTFTGAMGEPIGPVTFIARTGAQGLGASHESYYWQVINGHFTKSEQTFDSELLSALLEYVVDTLSPEELDSLYLTVIRLFSFGENNEYFGDGFNIPQLIENVITLLADGSLGDAADSLKKLFLNHPASDFFDKVYEVLDIAAKIGAVLSVIPVIGPYCKAAAEIFDLAAGIVQVVDWTLQLVYNLHKAQLAHQAAAYLAQYPSFHINLPAMPNIEQYLAQANMYLERAKRSAGGLAGCMEPTIEDFLLPWNAFIGFAFGFGVAITYLGKDSKIQKMQNAAQEVRRLCEQNCNIVAGAVGLALDDVLTVNPNQLKSRADDAKRLTEQVEQNIENVATKIKNLGSGQKWKGPDFDSLAVRVNEDTRKLTEIAKVSKGYYNLTSSAASVYAKMQKDALSQCQDAVAGPWYLAWLR